MHAEADGLTQEKLPHTADRPCWQQMCARVVVGKRFESSAGSLTSRPVHTAEMQTHAAMQSEPLRAECRPCAPALCPPPRPPQGQAGRLAARVDFALHPPASPPLFPDCAHLLSAAAGTVARMPLPHIPRQEPGGSGWSVLAVEVHRVRVSARLMGPGVGHTPPLQGVGAQRAGV
jgi:hypothetical protein